MRKTLSELKKETQSQIFDYRTMVDWLDTKEDLELATESDYNKFNACAERTKKKIIQLFNKAFSVNASSYLYDAVYVADYIRKYDSFSDLIDQQN